MSKRAKILSKKETALSDGLENLVAEIGTASDKRHASRFVNQKRLSIDGNEQELNAMYRTDWLSGKVVDIIPNDMTREWRSFSGEINPDIVQRLEDEENRLLLRSAFNLAHKWARLYGTAFIVMSIDDGGQPHEPLNLNKVREGSLRHIKVIDRHRLHHSDVVPIANPLNANFGFPEYYRFAETSVRIHHSRVLRFDGVLLPWDEFRRNNYFSDSVLDRLYESITNLNTVTNGAASMVYETNVDILKVKGLMGYLQSADGEGLLRKRFGLAKVLKSFNNMMLLDSEEDFETKTNTFSGLPDLLDRYANLLASAADIPATRFLGSSAQGMNATGEGDLKNYYDKIGADQVIDYKPRLDYFDSIMVRSMGLPEDDDYSYTFNSLFQMTPKEKSEVDFNNAQRDQIYLTNDVVTELIVAKELKQTGTYTNINDKFIAEMEELEDLDDDFDTDPDVDPFEEEEKEDGKSATRQDSKKPRSSLQTAFRKLSKTT